MPRPEVIHLIALIATFLLLIGTLKHKVCLASAYLFIIVTKPGLYYPVLAQLRFELIIAIFLLILILISPNKGELLSLDRSKILRYMFYFLIVIFVSMIQAFDIGASWERIYTMVLPACLLTLLILVFCREIKDVRFFLWTFGIVTASLGYEPVYRYLSGDVVNSLNTGVGNFSFAISKSGIASGHVSLAHYLVQGMPFLWYLSVTSPLGL